MSLNIWIIVSKIINPLTLILLSIILGVYLFYRKKYKNLFILILSLSLGYLLKSLIKILIARPRPENPLIQTAGFSFPSGHVTIAAIFFLLMIYFFKDNFKSKLSKNIFIISNISLILLVSISRIYLRVHWFSDIIGGILLGSICIIFSIKMSKKIRKRNKI